MSLNPQKKEESQELGNTVEQDQLENAGQNANSPEFDEIGTGLNEI